MRSVSFSRYGSILLAAALAVIPACAQKINLATQVQGELPTGNAGFGVSTAGLTGCASESNGVWTINTANCGVQQVTGPSSTVNGDLTFSGPGVTQSGNTFTFNGSCASGDCIMGASSVSQNVTQTNSSFGATVNYRGTTLATPLTNLGLQFNGSGPGYYNNNGPWAGHTALNIDFLNNSPGIDHGINGNFTDLKVGDAAWQYAYLLFYGGAYFGSDEGLAGINIKPQQVGYFQGNLTTPTVGELYEAYSGGPSGVTFLLDGANSGNSTFTGSGVLASVSLPFAQTPATAGPAYIVVWTPGTGNNATINQVLPITLAAGTGTQTFTSADFGTVNIVQGESLGVYVPTGSAPGLTTAQGLCSTATGVPVVGPITTETSDCGYPNAGSVVMQGQLAAPTKGSTTLAIANFACESHTQGCLGQAGWEWATGGTLLDMQNSTPPQATFISNAGTILNDSIAFNIGNTTVTESTAWGNVGTCTATGGQDNLSPATDTCQITLGTSPASPGSFVAGEDACMAGWYQEEVPIISVGTASGGVQSITFTTYHGWSGSNSPIMQGGPCGQFVINSNSWGSGSSGWPAAYQVLGATSTTQILLANCVVGGCIGEGTSPTPALLYAGLQYNASVSLTRTNNVVSVSAPPGHVGPYMNIFDFSIGQTINVAGCTVDTDLNGSYTITVNSYDNQNQSLGWAQTGANEGPDGTCSINMGYPEYTFYPGAFISASSNENNMIVQPNQVVWNSGDFVVEAPAAVYSESDIIDTHGQGSIPYNNESQLTLQDQGPAWVSSNINVSNGATGKTNPGNIMLVANGTWIQDFALYQAPAENGCIICEGEGNPGPGTYTPPYYLFYAGSARWLRVDPINDYFNIGNNLSVGGTVAPASISFIGGSPGSASPDTAVPSVILLGTSAIQGYNQTPSTNTVNLYATGTNVGMSIGSGTTFEGLFTASNATGQMNFAQTPTVNGVPLVTTESPTFTGTATAPTVNATTGYQINGSYGTAGYVLTSTGTGSEWTAVSGTGTVTSVTAPTADWPSWLVPSVATGTTTPVISVTASAIPTSALAGPFVDEVIGPSSTVSGNITLTGSGVTQSGNTFTITGGGSGSGTVTSVGLTVPSDETVTGSPVTTSGTLAVTRNSETANEFLASPNGAAGVPSYRAIVAADIPTLNQNTTGTAANVTGVVGIANGGTGATTASAALTALGAAPIDSPTFTGPVTVDSTGASQANFIYNSTALVPGSATTAVIGVNSSGQGMLSEAGGAAARICDATNGVCSAGSGVTVENAGTSLGTATTINFTSPVTATLSGTTATVTSSGGGSVNPMIVPRDLNWSMAQVNNYSSTFNVFGQMDDGGGSGVQGFFGDQVDALGNPYALYTTGTTADTQQGYASASAWIIPGRYPTFKVSLGLGASTGVNAWVALTGYGALTLAGILDPSSSGSTSLVGFRYFSGTDTDWTCYEGNGSVAGQTVSSGVAPDTTNLQTFDLIITTSGVYDYYINGTQVCSFTPTNPLPATSKLEMMTAWENTTTTSVTVKQGRLYEGSN